MKIRDMAIDQLREASWNPNDADEATLERLSASVARFGAISPLVIRPVDGAFEVIGGNQRLRVYREHGIDPIPCIEVALDATQARLLGQALNAIHGEDDLNKKAALAKELLAHLPQEAILAILPETPTTLRGLSTLGEQTSDSLAKALATWDKARAHKFERMSFPLTPSQKEIIEEAVARAMPRITASKEPNRKALALLEICRDWLKAQGDTPAL